MSPFVGFLASEDAATGIFPRKLNRGEFRPSQDREETGSVLMTN